MSNRKPWTQEEDKVLKFLKEEDKIKKWSHIARKMGEDYKMIGRNGKQCRERYYNHIDDTVKKEEWTIEEENHLYQLHDQIGNKWAVIAQKMNGRTDNCVKNHFYSKLRKSLRKLNKAIHDNFKKQFRQLRMTILYKVIQATDDRFKDEQTISSQLSEHSSKLKNMLLEYSNDENEFEHDLSKIKEFISSIYKFNNMYKRKPKKCRQNTAQNKKLMKQPKIQKFKCTSDIEDDEVSNDYLDASEEQSFQLVNVQHQEKLSQSNGIIMPTPIRMPTLYVPNAQMPNQNLILSQSMNVEYVLNNAGLLQDAYMLSMSQFFKRSLSVSLNSEFSQSDNKLKGSININGDESTGKSVNYQKGKEEQNMYENN